MPQVFVNPWIKNFIESHARSSPQEIYGWLIGFESPKGDIYVITALTCEKYTTQHYVGAAPDPLEKLNLGSSIPEGLGIIGLYHSHPDEVFHSSVDDQTLINLCQHDPKVISAVTNGEITKWYKLMPEGNTSEFKIIYKPFPSKKLKFLIIYMDLDLNLPVKFDSPIIPQITTKIFDFFENAWENSTFSFVRNGDILKHSFFDERKPALPAVELFENNKGKVLKVTRFSELGLKHFKHFVESDVNIKINAKMVLTNGIQNSSASPENPTQPAQNILKKTRVTGKIPVLGILMINKENLELNLQTVLNLIKKEIKDSLIITVSKSLLKYFYNSGQIGLVSPDPVVLLYPQILLKINVLLKKTGIIIEQSYNEIAENLNIRKENLPDILKIIELENSMLKSLFKRIVAIARADKKILSKFLLQSIAKFHEIRGQQEESEKILNIMSFIEKF